LVQANDREHLMSKAPPIPQDQQGASGSRPRVSGRHAQPEGAKAHADQDPQHQGQSANTRQNTRRSGKTQDR
jgi:hypothetical protein